ncbi:MAG: zinc dependent phospholipase C family protein, partial [Rhodocyclaceae bacterium]|nr:zinc dependent phospholipase C family protein [Rhodocyclaceae bacterium]
RGIARSDNFADSHDWALAASQLEHADCDESRALALGYASHLLTDIFAHNHFVPAHENVWANVPVVTHASCEWALDHHVRKQLFATPGQLLNSERATIVSYLNSAFDCPADEATRLINTLGRADRLLRFSRLPAVAHVAGKLGDRRMVRRFNHYLDQTVRRLPQINALLVGEYPQWSANPPRHLAHTAIAGASLQTLRSRLSLPADVFLNTDNI